MVDYKVASDVFLSEKDIARYSDARANYALTLYQVNQEEEAVKVMKDIIRKNPGYADMHVAIAADAWSRGDYINALKVSSIIITYIIHQQQGFIFSCLE